MEDRFFDRVEVVEEIAGDETFEGSNVGRRRTVKPERKERGDSEGSGI